jgi:hypothetical protein
MDSSGSAIKSRRRRSKSLQVRLIVRDDVSRNNNLFVRLSPDAARDLQNLALQQLQQQDDQRRNSTASGWDVGFHATSCSNDPPIQFLPLKICLQGNKVNIGNNIKGEDDDTSKNYNDSSSAVIVYASYNGGNSIDKNNGSNGKINLVLLLLLQLLLLLLLLDFFFVND